MKKKKPLYSIYSSSGGQEDPASKQWGEQRGVRWAGGWASPLPRPYPAL